MKLLDTVKKASQLAAISTVAVIFVVVAIVGSFGSKITNEVYIDLNSSADAGAVASNGTAAIGKLMKYLPLMALVVAAAIIISVVMGSFRGGKQ